MRHPSCRRHVSFLACSFCALLAVAVLAAGCSGAKAPAERETSLHKAADDGDIAGVKRLLDEGVDVNVRDEGGATPLHVASFRGHHDVIKLLLAKGADIKAKDKDGDTPLSFARDTATEKLLKGAR